MIKTCAWHGKKSQKNKARLALIAFSIKRWRRNWEERLVELQQAVYHNVYLPRRPRFVYIPKASGGYRKISILTVTDRVLQRAVLRVVDDVFERAFLDCSYGYRSGRGVRNAIPAILRYRDLGLQWVFDADIDDCFGSLNHSVILEFFAKEIDDPMVIGLVEQWMRMGNPGATLSKGILMGGVLSPLLCNIVLHRLDVFLVEVGFTPIRYADDFCVFCENRNGAERGLGGYENLPGYPPTAT